MVATFPSEVQEEVDVTSVEKQEQFHTAKLAESFNVKKESHKLQESDTPVEENEEGMLPEDGVLLTYVLKQDQKEHEVESVDSVIKSMLIPDKDVNYSEESSQVYCRSSNDVPRSSNGVEHYYHEISESSQKSREKKEVTDDIEVLPSTSLMIKDVTEDEDILEEDATKLQLTVQLTMIEKLAKAVKNFDK